LGSDRGRLEPVLTRGSGAGITGRVRCHDLLSEFAHDPAGVVDVDLDDPVSGLDVASHVRAGAQGLLDVKLVARAPYDEAPVAAVEVPTVKLT